MLTWWTVARDALRDIQESGFGGVGHACEFETSLLMHFAPHLVETQAIADTQMPQPYCWAKTDMLNATSGLLYSSMKTQSELKSTRLNSSQQCATRSPTS